MKLEKEVSACESPPAFEDLRPAFESARRADLLSGSAFAAPVVQDRIRNYLQKYIPTAQEVTDLQVVEAGFTLGHAEIREGESRDDRKAAGCAAEKTRAGS